MDRLCTVETSNYIENYESKKKEHKLYRLRIFSTDLVVLNSMKSTSYSYS